MITLEQIQKQIIEAIKQSGITQTEIAKRLKITQSSIAHYIKGDIAPALDTFANLCAILDLDANEILCLTTYKKEENNNSNKSINISNSFNNINNTGNFKL